MCETCLQSKIEQARKRDKYFLSIEANNAKLKEENLSLFADTEDLKEEVERLKKGWDKETEALHRWIVAEKDLQSQLDKANEEDIRKAEVITTANKRIAEYGKAVDRCYKLSQSLDNTAYREGDTDAFYYIEELIREVEDLVVLEVEE